MQLGFSYSDLHYSSSYHVLGVQRTAFLNHCSKHKRQQLFKYK